MSHMDTRMSWEPDKPHEECGVFGMYDLDGNDVASSIYYGRHSGSVWSDWTAAGICRSSISK